MAAKTPELIVLDCDGVILESVAVKTEAFGKLVSRHGPDATERMIDFHQAHGGMSRFEKFSWFYHEMLGRPLSQTTRDRLNSEFAGLCLNGVLASPFVPGAIEFIESWQGRVPLYVASATPHEELETIFRKRNLARFFKGIFGMPPAKEELLARIVDREGILPEKTLMVGDSSTDEEAAVMVGTRFFGRGEKFAGSGWPWGKDLFGLIDYLAAGIPIGLLSDFKVSGSV
ncbi:MAG: HAD family hydrolase [Desulfobacterales bacterium]|nr:HAD family hydrolase [Desulfobacterales bacterium]